jgi:hypothetical protein
MSNCVFWSSFFVYFVWCHIEEELATPPLDDGLILPGVVRNSLLELARQSVCTLLTLQRKLYVMTSELFRIQ